MRVNGELLVAFLSFIPIKNKHKRSRLQTTNNSTSHSCNNKNKQRHAITQARRTDWKCFSLVLFRQFLHISCEFLILFRRKLLCLLCMKVIELYTRRHDSMTLTYESALTVSKFISIPKKLFYLQTHEHTHAKQIVFKLLFKNYLHLL